MLAGLGIAVRVVPKLKLDDGIDAVRSLLPTCWFDEAKCERGLSALKEYQKAWNDTMKCYSDTPRHDWASHGADAFRYLAVGMKKPVKGKKHKADTGWIV